MGTIIREMTEEDWVAFELIAEAEGIQEDVALRQSYNRSLMLTELSDYDLDNMTTIIEGHGDWFKAKLLRALHVLLQDGDGKNRQRLRFAFPGTCAAYLAWYNGRIPPKRSERGSTEVSDGQ